MTPSFYCSPPPFTFPSPPPLSLSSSPSLSLTHIHVYEHTHTYTISPPSTLQYVQCICAESCSLAHQHLTQEQFSLYQSCYRWKESTNDNQTLTQLYKHLLDNFSYISVFYQTQQILCRLTYNKQQYGAWHFNKRPLLTTRLLINSLISLVTVCGAKTHLAWFVYWCINSYQRLCLCWLHNLMTLHTLSILLFLSPWIVVDQESTDTDGSHV